MVGMKTTFFFRPLQRSNSEAKPQKGKQPLQQQQTAYLQPFWIRNRLLACVDHLILEARLVFCFPCGRALLSSFSIYFYLGRITQKVNNTQFCLRPLANTYPSFVLNSAHSHSYSIVVLSSNLENPIVYTSQLLETTKNRSTALFATGPVPAIEGSRVMQPLTRLNRNDTFSDRRGVLPTKERSGNSARSSGFGQEPNQSIENE